LETSTRVEWRTNNSATWAAPHVGRYGNTGKETEYIIFIPHSHAAKKLGKAAEI
jgi:hypothetical protein